MKKNLLKSLLLSVMTLTATGAWADAGDVTVNADIDFSNAITNGVVTGTVNQIAIGTGGAESIIQDGWLRLGDHANVVTIAEEERAGSRDVVTISFKMAFGNKNGMGSGFRVKDANGNEIATYQHARWNGNPGNTLGIDMAGLMGAHSGNAAVAANATSYVIAFDYAKKQIISTLTLGETTKEFKTELTSTNPIATFEVFGYGAGSNADRASIFDDLKITTTEGNYNVETANYTVNFVFNGEVVETSERAGDVGDAISLFPSDKEPRTIDGKKYFYVSDDAEGKTVAADVVVTVTLREAETWNYTFNAVLGGNVLKAIGEGTVVEGEEANVTWPRYVLNGTALAYRDAVSNSYYTTFTPEANNEAKGLDYQKFAGAENVIFYSEAEDIATLEPITDLYLPNRFSAGRGAYAKEDGSVITSVEQGKKYKLTARLMGTQAVVSFKFRVGNRVIWEHATSSNSFYPGTDSYTETFVAAKNADITLDAAGGVVVSGRVTNAVDYIYLEEVGAATDEELAEAAAADEAADAAAALAEAKAELEAAINEAKAIETTDKEGVDELNAAIEAAENALAADDATVESLAAAKAALAEAVAAFDEANKPAVEMIAGTIDFQDLSLALRTVNGNGGPWAVNDGGDAGFTVNDATMHYLGDYAEQGYEWGNRFAYEFVEGRGKFTFRSKSASKDKNCGLFSWDYAHNFSILGLQNGDKVTITSLAGTVTFVSTNVTDEVSAGDAVVSNQTYTITAEEGETTRLDINMAAATLISKIVIEKAGVETIPTINIDRNTLALIPGATQKLVATIDPTGAVAQWKSSNEEVATVAEDGTVTAIAAGEATISYVWTSEVSDATAAAECVVTVAAVDLSALTVTSIDFTTMGDVTLELSSEVAGAIWNEANNKNNNVFFCTNEGLENIAVQAAVASNKGWSIVDGKGLFLASGAGRCAAIGGIKAQDIVEFIYTGNGFYTRSDDDGVDKIALNEGTGRAIYQAKEDGMMGFELDKGNAVQVIKIYKDPTVGIEQLKNELELSQGQIFNLQGQKVSKAVKGLYIVNGKKVVMK